LEEVENPVGLAKWPAQIGVKMSLLRLSYRFSLDPHWGARCRRRLTSLKLPVIATIDWGKTNDVDASALAERFRAY
jgi:hypothetical protein